MKKFILSLLLALTIFTLPSAAFAQEENWLKGNECVYPGGAGIGEVVTIACIPVLFANAIFWLLIFSGTVAVFLIMFGGIKFLTSGGDQKSVDAARKIITWAVIGLVVVLMSFGIVAFVSETTGIACIKKFGFDQCGLEEPRSGIKPANPGTKCKTGGQCFGGTDCFVTSERDPDNTDQYIKRCLYACSQTHHGSNAWCPAGQSCQSTMVGGTSIYLCKPRPR